MPSKRTQSGSTATERERLVAKWERSGLTQREYCRQIGIPVTTFDYYRRRQLARTEEARTGVSAPPAVATPLVQVRLAEHQPPTASPTTAPSAGFAITLRNGRRLEAGWAYPAAALAQLIAIVEQP